jgi:hypothetical protein
MKRIKCLMHCMCMRSQRVDAVAMAEGWLLPPAAAAAAAAGRHADDGCWVGRDARAHDPHGSHDVAANARPLHPLRPGEGGGHLGGGGGGGGAGTTS